MTSRYILLVLKSLTPKRYGIYDTVGHGYYKFGQVDSQVYGRREVFLIEEVEKATQILDSLNVPSVEEPK